MTALRPRALLVDGLLAGILATVFVVEVLLVEHPGPLWASLLTALGVTVPLAWRRRRPLLVAAVVCAVIVQAALWTLPIDVTISPLLPVLIVGYSLGAHAEDRRRAWIGLLLIAATVVLVSALMRSSVWGDYVFPTLIVALGWVGGRLVRSRTLLAAELHEEAVRAEDERERHAELAVAEERRRIARELHDVVAHSMSVMVVQAGGARRIGQRDPARAVEAAAQIERTGREALAEMRRLLGVLRVDASLTPQPSMDGVGALVERARDAGLPVELRVEGDRRALPAGVDLAGYRIVQEALTNAMKHAGSAPTSVVVRYRDDALELEVADRPDAAARARSAPATDGAGHGLIGMRERVRMVGGDLHAGPSGDGGFDVRARLPLERAEVAAR